MLLYILSGVCLLLGFAGCFLPVLPGPPVAYMGLLLLQATERFGFTVGAVGRLGVAGCSGASIGLCHADIGYEV